jgi:Leucine-rich repeat (LRR) protein
MKTTRPLFLILAGVFLTACTTAGTTLSLANQSLTKVPDYVFGQTQLTELNVSGNKLTGAIQGEVRHLSKLKVLNASDNQLTGIPAEIGQLSNLEALNFADNKITGLPLELGNLQNLKVFNISGNPYSEQDLASIVSKWPKTTQVIK